MPSPRSTAVEMPQWKAHTENDLAGVESLGTKERWLGSVKPLASGQWEYQTARDCKPRFASTKDEAKQLVEFILAQPAGRKDPLANLPPAARCQQTSDLFVVEAPMAV